MVSAAQAPAQPRRKPAPFGCKMVLSLLALVPLLLLVVVLVVNVGISTNVEQPPADFGSGIMFNDIAARYDIINRVLAMRMDISWRKRMIDIIKQRLEEKKKKNTEEEDEDAVVIMDVATGTADVALMIGNMIPHARVIGVDPSGNMIDIGTQKILQQQLSHRISLHLGDARALQQNDRYQHDNMFDAATMAFGIRNVPKPRALALCEIHRVLKKGAPGRESDGAPFGILEFSEPDVDTFGLLGYGARIFIRYVVPVVGGILSGKLREYLHLQNSIQDFPTPQEFGTLLESLRCGPTGTGYFIVDDIIQMNFGSVQLYVTTAALRPEQHDGGGDGNQHDNKDVIPRGEEETKDEF